MGLLGRGLKARTRTRCVRGLTLSVLGSADRPLAVTLARVRYSRSFAFVVFEPFVVHHGFDDIRVHSRVAGPTELRTDRIAEAGVVDDGSDAREFAGEGILFDAEFVDEQRVNNVVVG